MAYLLDTHTFIWASREPSKLSAKAAAALADPAHQRFLSAASVWEMAIKSSLGKLRFGAPLQQYVEVACRQLDASILPVENAHLYRVETLPYPSDHKNPFDRLIVVQSLTTVFPVITADTLFAPYGVSVVW